MLTPKPAIEARRQDTYPIALEVRKTVNLERPDCDTGGKPNGSLEKYHPDQLGQQNGQTASTQDVEIINAKYLIGCDGAHSWTRNQVGISLEGESTGR